MNTKAFTKSNQRDRTSNDFIAEFTEITGLHPIFDEEYRCELDRLVDYLLPLELRPLSERRREFLAHVNWKFRLNAEGLAGLFGAAADAGHTFNYHAKKQVQRAFDLSNASLLEEVLTKRAIDGPLKTSLLKKFHPIDESQTISHLIAECCDPSKLRIERGARDIAGEIAKAQFSAFMWASLPSRELHKFFDTHFGDTQYCVSFWEQLHARSSQLFNRDNALHILRISQSFLDKCGTTDSVRNAISHHIESAYHAINNYGFLAVLIDPSSLNDRCVEWEIAADITLFAEKHRQQPLKKAYFQWERIRDETKRHIPNLNIDDARFDLVNEGFAYRDCFVLTNGKECLERLLLVFQKNERDETPVPCPTCRSANVQGNSYSSLGVRSWECNNVLCPDRSKYNRGKRYSFRALMMQQAIDDERSEIPVASVRRWSRDVVSSVSDAEVANMLVRHYSMSGDTVHVYNWLTFGVDISTRQITHHELQINQHAHEFWTGPFFQRYLYDVAPTAAPLLNLGTEDFQVLLGDSAAVLRNMPKSIFDGAVTSPPYYNAREYAQWKNIYCYLHDMHIINAEVFRTLKPGALYLYNIFDYFDNENSIVFSAMGQRRMLLSAYSVDSFRRIGFELLGNIAWDKGDIEGKRGFNAGNFSPFYQSPFNCWEHILVLRKPAAESAASAKRNAGGGDESVPYLMARRVFPLKPVIKMVRGENTHGHSAPFPDAVPELMVAQLSPGDLVLDPFGGSLTTGRVAERYGLRSVCIERSEEYCRLGLGIREAGRQLVLTTHDQLSLFEN